MTQAYECLEWRQLQEETAALRTQLTAQAAELARARGLLLKRSNFYGDEGQLFNKMVEDWKNEDCWSDWDETIYQTRMQIEKEIYDFLHPPAPEGADNAHK